MISEFEKKNAPNKKLNLNEGDPMADIAKLGFDVDSRPLDDASKSLDNVSGAARRTEQATEALIKKLGLMRDSSGVLRDRMGRLASETLLSRNNLDRFGQTVDRTAVSFNNAVGGGDAMVSMLKRLAAGLGTVISVKTYQTLADQWSDLQARVGLAVGSMDNAAAVMDRLSSTARMTYSSLNSTTEGFIRNSMVLKELGKSTKQQLDYTEALNNALVVSGARGRNAEFVQESLSRSMALGAMRGIELNNVLNYGGRIAELLAAELGTTTNGLRTLATEGKITSEVIYNALIKNMEILRKEAESMPATIGDAFILIGNSVLSVVGTFDKLTGASEWVSGKLIKVSDGLKWTADNMGMLLGTVQNGISAFAELSSLVGGSINTAFSNVGVSLSGVVKWFTSLFDVIPSVSLSLGELATAMGIAFSPAIVALLGTITALIGGALLTAVKAVTLGFVAMIAANPFGALLMGISLILAGMYVFRDAIQNVFGVDFVQVAKQTGNNLVGTFVGAYRAIVAIWNNFPGAIGNAVLSAVNVTIAGVERMINAIIRLMNTGIGAIYNSISGAAGKLGVDLGKFEGIAEVSVGRVANEFSQTLGDAASSVKDAFNSAFTTDYMGNLGAALGTVTEKLKLGTNAAKTFNDTLYNKAPTSNSEDGSGGKQKESFDKIVRGAEARIAKMQAEQQALFMSAEAAARLKYETDLLNQAKRANITLSDEQRSKLMELAGEMAKTEIETKRLKDALDFGKDITKGFLNDFLNSVKQGESVFQAFGKAAMNVLNKIADKLISMAVDGLFTGGGGKGGIGGLLSSFFSFFKPSALGNAFGPGGQVQPFAKGGAFTNSVVSNPTLFAYANGGAFGVMGEAGPEAIMPLKRGPDGSLGVQMHGGRSAGNGPVNNSVEIKNEYKIEGAISSEDVTQAIRRAGEDQVKYVRKNVVGWLEQYNVDGALV
jgi:tape measure domain-containing protein